MSYTQRKSLSFSYPTCLELEIGTTRPDPGREFLLDFMGRHNATVRKYVNDPRHTDRNARAILDLGRGISQWIELSGYADDGLLALEVTVPLLQAFCAALNGDIGYLDAGTLDSWARDLATHHGINLDTGEFL